MIDFVNRSQPSGTVSISSGFGFLGDFSMPTYPVIYRLPTQYSTAIGRIVTRFSVLESALRNLIYALLELDPKMGRVAVKNPRIDDSFTMIQDLMGLRSFTTILDIKRLAGDCRKLEQFRDKVAHGIWVRHSRSDVPILQVTAGSHPDKPGGKATKGRIRPATFEVTPETFRSHARGIDVALKAVKQLGRELGAQHRALRKKLREQSGLGQ